MTIFCSSYVRNNIKAAEIKTKSARFSQSLQGNVEVKKLRDVLGGYNESISSVDFRGFVVSEIEKFLKLEK